jgi:sugar phosphate isomerase/epimerase
MTSPIPILFSTGSLFNFDVDTVMALAKEAGFDGVELVIDWRRETYWPEHLHKLMVRHGLPILAVHSPFAQSYMPGWPADPVASIKQTVQLAETVGARLVVVHPPGRWLRLQGLVATPDRTRRISIPLPVVGPGKLGRWLQEALADFQATTDVTITVENMPCRWLGPIRLEPHHFFTPAALLQFPYLTLDTTHVGTRKIDLLLFYRQIRQRVAHVHLSNFNGQEHQLLSDGSLPLQALLRQLAQYRYQGFVSLELGPTSLQAEDERCLKQNLHNSLRFCRQALQTEKS